MNEWDYRKCPKCTKNIYVDVVCECGGDPWHVKNRARIRLKEVRDKMTQLKKEWDKWNIEKKALMSIIRIGRKKK